MHEPARTEPAFTPFADGETVRTVGALSFENGPDTIALHGTLDLTRDESGLAQARALKEIVDSIVATLETVDLPAAIAEADTAPSRVRNPFA